MSWHRNLHWHVKLCLSCTQCLRIKSAAEESPQKISSIPKVDSVTFSHIKVCESFLKLCVCVCVCLGVLCTFQHSYAYSTLRYAAAVFCSLTTAVTSPVYSWHTWMTQFFLAQLLVHKKVGEMKKHDEPLCRSKTPLCLVMTRSHTKKEKTHEKSDTAHLRM